MSSSELDASNICQNDQEFTSIYKYFSRKRSKFIQLFEQLFYKKWGAHEEDYCIRSVKSMAFVEVQYNTNTVSQTIRDVRYTFAGILSSLGNNQRRLLNHFENSKLL